jgi:hypothetical protein
VLSSIAGLLRVASLVICLIVIASFAIFAIDQTGSASTHQQEELGSLPSRPTTTSGAPGSPAPAPSHKSALHSAIDNASNDLTSPFSGLSAGSSSEWATRGLNLLIALAVYGFGLGFLARTIRVRV